MLYQSLNLGAIEDLTGTRHMLRVRIHNSYTLFSRTVHRYSMYVDSSVGFTYMKYAMGTSVKYAVIFITCVFSNFAVSAKYKNRQTDSTDQHMDYALNEMSINSKLSGAAAFINRTLPKMIDSETRWERVIGGNMSFIYIYTKVDISAEEIDNVSFTQRATPDIIQQVCSKRKMDVFMRNEVTVTYAYHGNEGGHIGSIDVNPSDC